MINKNESRDQESSDRNQEGQQIADGENCARLKQGLSEFAERAKRSREELDRAFREDGIIRLSHFNQAKHLLFDYAVQKGKTFRVEDLRHLILVRDRINTFIDHVELDNGGSEEVERLLLLLEDEGENWRLNVPHGWN